MAIELFFIYDTHCPWSYVTTPLVNAISQSLPQVNIHLWHNAYYDGDTYVDEKQLREIKSLTDHSFSANYLANINQSKDATCCANIMAWAENKAPQQAIALLNAIQKAHFEQGNELTTADAFTDIISELKMSPPTKVFRQDKLSKDAEAMVHEILSLQEIIATQAIPALLLAVDNELVLLNHNFYLQQPEAIVDAVKMEIEKLS
ncbi:hypothetical protein [Litorilituus lipolyticus]|uniref:Protein-disulfide isomerase n=1 Tax=Litorilituus lipolyticus TaxID=2491017 RepID=A0A502KQ68_9GAMM|nr:hypothetical protein [Litorilituus lipolyticus]TPH13850.1 hypothetical protein EPA86_12010 [Litorilituus lipolyticus]